MNSPLIPLAEPHSSVEFRVTAWCPPLGANESIDDASIEYTVSYFAPDADLISAGIVSAEMLGRGKCGQRRRDAAGNLFRLHRRKTFAEVCFSRLPAPRAITLYGVTRELVEAAVKEHEEWMERYTSQCGKPRAQEIAEIEESPDYARGLAWGIVQRGIEESIPSGDEAKQLRLIREVLTLSQSRRPAAKILGGALSQRCSLEQTVNLLRQAPLRGAVNSRRLILVVDNTR